MKRDTVIKIFISLGAIGLLVGKLVVPALQLDAISIALLIVAILPWLSSIVESAEFPGGWKVKFRDVQAAGEKVTAGSAPEAIKAPEEEPSFVWVAQNDPNLALVGLRIEIERRLRRMAEMEGLSQPRSLSALLNILMSKGIISGSSMSGLQELIYAGNQAAHGARVEPEVASWAVDYGPEILASLDAKLRE
jgi:hypothetical protein